MLENIQEIAYREKDEIRPDQHILLHKQKDKSSYFITKPPFTAKCPMREAPGILESLVNEMNELVNGGRLGVAGLRPQGVDITLEQLEEIRKYDKDRKKFKVEVDSRER